MFFQPITNVATDEAVAALTFDDGPHPVFTPRVLAILEKYRATATFFMVGEAASRYPEIVRMVGEAGHVIGNHSWSHLFLPKTHSRFRRLQQLWKCAHATAPYGKRLFRPPYGAQNRQVQIDALMLGYTVILWSVSAQDWIPQHSDEIANKIINRVAPGSIFLLHDAIYRSSEPHTQWDRGPVLDGLERALAVVNRRIQFVTIPALLRVGRPVSNWPRPVEQLYT